MSLLDFLITGMVFDISFIVFLGYFIWKNKKISTKVESLEKQIVLTTLNPQKARRTLKNKNNKL